ncbi:MAG: tRNA-(ms[2]io[6]A)-hydroxylase [Phenylobacterium sp.]|jgi:tRNA-(ms[2]io[6]A)-hydroxylase
MNELLAPINAFLSCQTPDAWVEEAIKPVNLPVLLQDHCTCELKAAQSAALLIRKYSIDKSSGPALLSWLKPYEDYVYRKVGDGQFGSSKNGLVGELRVKAPPQQAKQQITSSAVNQQILDKMVRLIKEELHHFEQVLNIMTERGLAYTNLSAARYASGMIKHVSSYEPAALVDKLIIGAYIEARSCERFAKLAPLLDDELNRFYVSLLRSEARHYQDYLKLAETIAQGDDKLSNGFAERVTLFAEVEAGLIQSPDKDFRFHSGKPA